MFLLLSLCLNPFHCPHGFLAANCQESQRRAVVESLMAAQQYCLLTTCRRKFLLGHFGEKVSADKCGMGLLYLLK